MRRGKKTVKSKLGIKEGEFLISLARNAVKNYLETGGKIEIPKKTPQKLLNNHGVFVTIKVLEENQIKLRGCIGYPYPEIQLAEAVIKSAISSATQDPRFRPLSLIELNKVVFELSILTQPVRIDVDKPDKYPIKIRVGEDGLIIEKNLHRGLLLPQVPTELGWDEEEYLCQCCIKAGLPPDCWLLEGTKIFKFQAIIFEEKDPGGTVVEKSLGGN